MERSFDDSRGLDSGPDVLFVWNIVIFQQSLHVLEVTAKGDGEGECIKTHTPGTFIFRTKIERSVHVVQRDICTEAGEQIC